MDVVLVRLHYVYAEIGAQFNDRENLFDSALHCSFQQTFPVLADEDEMAFKVPLVSAVALVCLISQTGSVIH